MQAGCATRRRANSGEQQSSWLLAGDSASLHDVARRATARCMASGDDGGGVAIGAVEMGVTATCAITLGGGYRNLMEAYNRR